MPKKRPSIPINNFGSEYHTGISIERMDLEDLPDLEWLDQPERHDRHSFHLVENGSITMEIDFHKYTINSPAVIYMHPSQIHRTIAFEKVVVTSWAINNENLNPEYIKLLEEITPAKPLQLKSDTFSIICEAVSVCIKLSQLQSNRLYHSLVKDSCNALVALVVSLYLEQSKPIDKSSRFETVTKAFREILALHYITLKRPTDYAKKLNISTPYLNECVKHTTGFSVSHHIQERVVLEAKRLLYHSNDSVKQVATALGYDDYGYFSRLFRKLVGEPPLSFRTKNLG